VRPLHILSKKETKIVAEHPIYYWNSIRRYKVARLADQIGNISTTAVKKQNSILIGANFMKQRNP
jgi:hypothetical protein